MGTLKQQHEELVVLLAKIDENLKRTDFQGIKELMLWLANSESYRKLKIKEYQLIILEAFCQIWVEEKKKLTELGITTDIFYGVDSLATLKKKYLTILFGVLRLETPMPEDYYEQVVDELIEYRVSGIALHKIIMECTAKKEENIIKMSKLLINRGQIVMAIFLLQKGNESYPKDKNILLELAACWMEGGQLRQAYDCLKKIRKPDKKVKELMCILEEHF